MILIIYSTTDGQTEKICRRLLDVIESMGLLAGAEESGKAALGIRCLSV